MRQHLIAIIALLAAIILALFSFDTASSLHSVRSYRTYNYNAAPSTWQSGGEVMPFLMPEGDIVSVATPQARTTMMTGNFSALPTADSLFNAPPALLATSAMTELTPVQLPPLDAGLVNVTGVFDGKGQAAGYRVTPRMEEFAIAVPYDPELLPQGFTEEDIQTYVYDRQYHRWIAIQRDSVNETELLVCSRFRPWEKGLSHAQDGMISPRDALAQVQNMMSVTAQGEGGGDSPLDFINAVLKTPEMPETSAYTPTSIKELKAADPLEGLTLIQPPTANNSGTANLSYPIEIPAGRQGMQPNLALTYNSGGGNGWLGVGWDISIPSITVETRWGVPRYDMDKESEVYVYEGEKLVTKDSVGNYRQLPHRTNQWTDRQDLDQDGYEQFYPRRNEAFDSIVRHGDSPSNYWWSVTHKNGVTDYYGKYKADTIVNNACVLRAGADNAHGPIAHWALAESVDPYGNSVRYRYDVEYHSGITSSYSPGRQIYIDSILYTAKGNDPGKYRVVFTRQQGREDIAISANRGFKEVTASTLCNIAVGYDNKYFKYYIFKTEYGRNTNFKTRLKEVAVMNKTTDTLMLCTDFRPLPLDSMSFTRFDYYDYPDATELFGDPVTMSLKNDTIKSTFVTNGGAWAKSTALGGTRGKSWNAGGTMTVGLGPVVPLTTASAGGNFNYSCSQSEGALTVIDLDGDGLPDKVYKKSNGKLYYRKHIADSEYYFHYDPEEHELQDYSDPAHPESLTNFLLDGSSTTTWGLQLSLGLAYSGSWPTTKSTTSVYFADVNADGLSDLITDDGVLFNVTERDGTVKFRNYYTIAVENAAEGVDSAFVHTTTDTCGGILFSGRVSDSITCQMEWKLDTILYISHSNHAYESANVSLFHYADSLGRTDNYRCFYIYCDDPAFQSEICEIDIYKKYLVSCDPFPTSTSVFDFLERDPDLEAVKVWVATDSGTVDIISSLRQRQDSTVSFLQSKTRDGMSYAIQHSNQVLVTAGHLLSASTTANTVILANGQIGKDDGSVHRDSTRIDVEAGDLIFFRLISGDNHAYDNVEWDQTIRYVGDTREFNAARDFVLSGDKCFGAGASGNTNKIDMSVKVSTGTLGNSRDTLNVMVVDTNGNILPNKKWTLKLKDNWNDTVWYPLGSPNATVVLLQSQQVKFTLSSSSSTFPWEKVRVTPHINYYVRNDNHYDTVECYPQVNMLIDNYDGSVLDSVYHHLSGPLYKGWGQFAYNNNDTVCGQIVHDSYIHLEKLVTEWGTNEYNGSEANKMKKRLKRFNLGIEDSTNVRESSEMVGIFAADTLYNPLSLKTSWVEMQPDFQHYAWIGYGNVNHITDSMMSNTRVPSYHCSDVTSDIEEYDHPVPVVAQGLDVKTVRKQNYSKMKNHSLSLSAPFVPFSVGGSVSKGYNLILTDYMDLNGDRYPDVLGPSLVQYTQPWGGIGDVSPLGIMENGITRSETESGGKNFGGSFEMPSRGASNNPKNSKISFDGAGNAGVSHGGGSDETSMTWMDMNADGLPDKVVCRNGYLKVSMNKGYGFLGEDTYYSSPYVREGNSKNTGLNFGGSFNIGQASIGGGIGVNFSKNVTGKMLMDFNSDGLPDLVEVDTSNNQNKLIVCYANGHGSWTSWDTLPALSELSFGRSFSESVDASLTVGLTFLSIIKLCVGLSGSPYNRTFSKDSIQLTDINGDGYIDYVTSQDEGSMTVRYSMAAKTNLLHKVTNFTGSSFELDYEMPLSCYDKAQRSWNLARVETRNNVDTCPVGGNRTLTTFEYETPKYNRHERMDYGYGRVTTYQYDTDGGDTLYRYTVEEYDNVNFNKRGRKTRDCVYDAAGNPYVEHIYGDTLYDYAGNRVTDGGCARTDVYVGRESDITNWYEGLQTPQLTSVTQREYDRYRNVVSYTHCGDTTHHDEWFSAEIDYAQNMSHNLTALPVRIVVKNHNGSVLQQRTATYNSSGKLVQLVRHNNTGGNAQYDFTYDSYGNLVGSTLPENINGERLMFSYEYDNMIHTYPLKVTNVSLGFFSTVEYDYKYGKPTRTVDINGNEMRYEYDNLGRTVIITAPYEIDNDVSYTVKMEYHPHNYGTMNIEQNSSNPYSYACTYHYDPQHSNDPIRTTLIADGLGRLLQTKKDAEIGGQEKSIVTGRVKYDCLGRTTEQYHPFEEDTSQYAVFNAYFDTASRTATWYDIMDRQTKVKLPTSDSTVMQYGFDTWNGKTLMLTVTTDAMGNSVQVMKGTMGQQIVQIAPMNTVTRFEYNCIGQLRKSTDPNGFETTYKYDWFGQMIHRNHPDAGDDYYEYDLAGNLTRHINASGEHLDYNYHYNQLTDIICSEYPENSVHYKYGTSSAASINAVGKIVLQEDASGWQFFKYGKLGELIENNRTFALPYDDQTYTFNMKFDYDSWNRILKMVYPDGEVLSYGYNHGGMLNSISGLKGDLTYRYIDSIRYNRFEMKDTIFYGNGTWTEYVYDTLLRLKRLRSHTSPASGISELMQDIKYDYDLVNNIIKITNSAGILLNGLGNLYQNQYEYDDLYRLTEAYGWWGTNAYSYQLEVDYFENGRIKRKSITALGYMQDLTSASPTSVSYVNTYDYGNTSQPNTLTSIIADSPQDFEWDMNGNMVRQTTTGYDRKMCWDEQNRLLGVVDEKFLSYYQYDANGERTFKFTGEPIVQNVSGQWHYNYILKHPTLYASPYVVCNEMGYTKHYYAESERVASRIGGGGLEHLDDQPFEEGVLEEKFSDVSLVLKHVVYDCLEQDEFTPEYTLQELYAWREIVQPELECYWYHTDHLGSSSWITDKGGRAVQHLHYLPWGEDFVNQRTTDFSTRHTFSSKERDTETGLSYFGSRYYSSDLSIWLSVDPMSDKYASLSPYNYCADNPVKLVDPNGMEVINPYKKMIEIAKKDISNAKIRLSNLQRGTPEYKSEKQQLRAARNDKRTAQSNFMIVLTAIKEVKLYNKKLYARINNLTDQTGAHVDVFVTVDEALGADKAGQCTNNWQNGHFSLVDSDNWISSMNGVKVSLNPTASSDIGLTLSHEFGHLDYIVPNIITYNKWLIDNGLDYPSYDGHSEDPLDLSGVSAKDAEKTHLRNRRGF